MPVTARTQPNFFIPFLGVIYSALNDVADVLFRLLVGLVFVPHGYQKLFVSFGHFVQFFGSLGFPSPVLVTGFIGGLEFFGGLAVAVGFLTRPLAFMFFVEMVVAAVLVHLPNGWFLPKGGEYVVTLAVIALVLSVRGGGRWSVDRVIIGREI